MENGVKEIIPSLGETFAHMIHNRIFVGKKKTSNWFTALLHKSNNFPPASAYFQVSTLTKMLNKIR